MKRLKKLTLFFIFIMTIAMSNVAYGFELGGGHGGAYDPNAYWPTQSNSTRLSSYPGIQEPFLKFTFAPTGSVGTSPVVGRDGEIYFCTYYGSGGKLYAVNPDGTEKWSVPCGYVRDGAPVIGADGTIYVASDAGVIAFNRDGTRKWTYEQGTGMGSLKCHMALDIDGNILITQIHSAYVGGEICDVYSIRCIDKSDGTSKWNYSEAARQLNGKDITNKASCAVSNDGTIYVKLGDKFVALNKYGSEKWTSSGGLLRKYYSKIAIDDAGNIYLTDYEPEYTGQIHCYTSDGILKWTAYAENVDIQDQCAIGPNGTIYAVTGWKDIDYATWDISYREGGLFTINPDTGAATEIYHDTNGIFNSPTIASDGMIYLDDGTALDSSGTKLWKVNGYGKPAVGKDGVLYYRRSVNGQQILCAYKDRQPGSIEWYNSYYSINEPSGTVTLTVRRMNGADGSVTVDYETIDGTAKAGVDYTSTSGTLTFGNGEAQKTVTIPIHNDRIYTGNRSFSVQLKNISGGGSLAGDIYAGVSILEDDAQDYDPPIIESITPSDNQENVSRDQEVTVTFNEYIIQGDVFDQITLLKDGVGVPSTCTISDKELTITPSSRLEKGTVYSVILPADSISDESGNLMGASFTSTFTTDSGDFEGGNGTPADPYLVATPRQLNEVRYYPSSCFKLMNNIDMSTATSEGGDYYNEGKGWKPLGDQGDFSGIFDGNGYVISGLNINREEYYVGLFDRNIGTILNLGLTEGNIISTNGGQSYLGGIAGVSHGYIFNCYNTSYVNHITTAKLTYTYNYHTGGIVGYNGGTIENCYNEGNVVSGGYYGYFSGTGGIAGYNKGTIKKCYNTSSMPNISTRVNNHVAVGGIAGINGRLVTDCYNTANISNGGKCGPIVGTCTGTDGGSTTENCYSIGVGDGQSGIADKTYESNVVLKNCYYYKSSDSIVAIRFISSFSPPTLTDLDPYTQEELKQKSTFTSFDFEQIWDINEGVSYPTFKPVVHPEGIALNNNALIIPEGSTYELTAAFTPQDTTNQYVIWSTSEDTVASVSNGVITANRTGSAVITAVTQDGGMTDTCTVTVGAPSSPNLSNLDINGIEGELQLSPAFVPETYEYSSEVDHSVESVTVRPTAVDPEASILVNNEEVVSGRTSSAIDLVVGENTIICRVVDSYAMEVSTYSAIINRLPSSNANLSNLALMTNEGTENISFSSDKLDYDITVNSSIDTMTVTPTIENANAVVTVNEETVASGHLSEAIHLSYGKNEIQIGVTAEDGVTTKTYTLNISRIPNITAFNINEQKLPTVMGKDTIDVTIAYGTDLTTLTPIVEVTDKATVSPSSMATVDFTNPVTYTVTAEDGITTHAYTVTVKEAACPNLSNWEIGDVTLDPEFEPQIRTYSAIVDNAVDQVTVTPTAIDSEASILINNETVRTSSAIDLEVGENTIFCQVTGSDGLEVRTYSAIINRLPSDNTSMNLAMKTDKGTKNLAFSSDHTCDLTVSESERTMVLIPTLEDKTASVTIDGVPIKDGQPTASMELLAGKNDEIKISVIAEDGTQTMYTLTIYRTPSANTDLNQVSIYQTDSHNQTEALNFTFDSNKTHYPLSIKEDIENITFAVVAADSEANVKISGDYDQDKGDYVVCDLDAKETNLTVEVTAEDGTKQTYTFTFSWQVDSQLEDLSLNHGDLSPEFNPNIYDYTVRVGSDINSIDLNYTLVDHTARVVAKDNPISLNIGENIIPITITAKDGSENNYTIKVYRGSENCDLEKMTLSNGTLEPVFTKDTTTYTAYVNHSVTRTEIKATASRTNSAITIDKVRTQSAITYTKNLEIGDNPIEIQVTAENELNQKTYTLNIIRKAASSVGDDDSNEAFPWRESDGKIDLNGIPDFEKSSNTAFVQVGTEIITKAFNNAPTEETGKKVEIYVPEVEGAQTYETTIPSQFAASNTENESIELHTAFASMILPTNMVNEADIQDAKVISVSVSEADTTGIDEETVKQIGNKPIIQLEMKIDGKPYSWHNDTVPVTVSIPYKPTTEEQKDPEHITVWYLDEAGNVVPVTSGRYDPKTGRVTFKTIHFSDYAIVYVKKAFNDLNSYNWAKKQIEVLASKGIINGTSNTTYAPEKKITRADYLTLLVKTLDLTAEVDHNFMDVNPEDYYYDAVGIANALGIVKGNGQNMFNPRAHVTRQDMMVMTQRALKISEKASGERDASILRSFTDQSQIADYAKDSIAALIEKGLIQGSGQKINPLSNTTRAEAAVLLYRIYNQ